jgi:hypothetical protein
MGRGFQVLETRANPDRQVVWAVGMIFEPVEKGLYLVESAHEDEVGDGNAAIDGPFVQSDIAALQNHLLSQEIGEATVDSLDFEIEVECLVPQRFNGERIDTDALHFVDGVIRFGKVKKSNVFHLG